MKWARGFAGQLAATGAAAVALALFVGGGGCELVVGDTLPDFSCVPAAHDESDPCPVGSMCVSNHCVPRTSCRTSSCAAGMQCDPTTLECIVSIGGAADSGSHHPDANMSRAESGADAPGAGTRDGSAAEGAPIDAGDGETSAGNDSGPCRDLACDCAGPSDCDSDVCGSEATVTTPVYDANHDFNFCTKPCCTSADCSATTVCFAAGTGGNYCVRPSWIGRTSPLGTAIGGAACKGASDCRSGLCASGTCADPCCSAATPSTQCATGTACRFSPFPGTGFDTHYTASCGAPSGALGSGIACAGDRSCTSDRCQLALCEGVCRNTPACGAGSACFYTAGPLMNKDIAAGCIPATGLGAEGSKCAGNGDCATQFCDMSGGGTTGVCSDVCFADSDCMKGWHCRPAKVAIASGANYYILCCGS